MIQILENYALIAFIVVLMIVCWLFSRRKHGFIKFVNWILIPITVIGGVGLYYFGYQQSEFESFLGDGLRSILSTSRMFVLGNDLPDVEKYMYDYSNLPMEFITSYMQWISFIHVLALIITSVVIIHLFGKRFINMWKIWLNKSKENYIFFGVNEESISLAEDLLKTNSSRLVVFVERSNKKYEFSLLEKENDHVGEIVKDAVSLFDKVEEVGAILVDKDYSKSTNLKKLWLRKRIYKYNSHLFFLSDNEDSNIHFALSLLKEIKTLSIKEGVVFYIRTISEDMEELITEKPSEKYEIRLLNRAEIAARQLVSKYNPVDFVNKDVKTAIATSDFNTMIIGFDQTGNAVLRKLIEYGQFVGSKFHVVVLDKAIHTKVGRFENRYPGLISHNAIYDIIFVETEVGCTEYYDLLKKWIDKLNCIIIALGNDTLNIQTAIDIKKLICSHGCKQVKIFIQVQKNESYEYFSQPNKSGSIEIFDKHKDVFTEQIIIGKSLECIARRINDFYNLQNSDKPNCLSWDELSQIMKQTNLSYATHIHSKLALIGLTVDDINKKFNNIEEFVTYLEKNDIYLNLAMGEHLRWNAVLYTNGWQTWSLDQLPSNPKTNKNEMLKLHACLVNWDELEKVNELFDKDYKKFDYDNVKFIYQLIKEGVIS